MLDEVNRMAVSAFNTVSDDSRPFENGLQHKFFPIPHWLFQLRTRYHARMPSGYRLPVPLTFKQFLPPLLLRIFPIQNLYPYCALTVCDVRPRFVLRYNAFQIQFADPLEQRPTVAVNMIHIS